MIATTGKAYPYKGGWVVQTVRPPVDNLSDEATILWHDARQISPEQRRKAWALIGEIAAWSGYIKAGDKTDLNTMLKGEFLRARVDALQAEAIKAFSLSDVDMTTARMYIDWLVEFCIVNHVPTHQPLYEYAEDIEAYVYACSMHRKCAICGKKADVHHWKRLGMGANRREAIHLGMPIEPLCRLHHQECHRMNQSDFDSKYHITPVTATEQICKRLGLKCNAE